ncbi:MAG: hypothetical protein EU532_00665 [Promethearchaeota archaeon]|nr:MAG: hypothetical protein EU532_00665 [Candidatus Lokiarchaeota archaeon]
MVQIEIHCPSCSKKGLIEVEENLIFKCERGVSAINVDENLICSHSFVAYIDKNLKVRDCFLTDFKIETPEMELDQIKKVKDTLTQDLIDVYLITININALWLTFILRSCFYKKKILIINNMEALNCHLINFFNFIFQDSFEFDIIFDTMDNYKKDKKKYREFIVIDSNNIINDKNNIMKPKMIKIERIIVQKFLAEQDPKSSLILIRNEIQKLFTLSQEIITFNKSLKENEELTSKKIMDYFEEVINIKVQSYYLDFLFEIINNYFNIKLAMSSKTSNFLGF